jgi:WXG100 family type VII secretion target
MIFNFVRQAVEGVQSQASGQVKVAEELLSTVNGFVPKIQGAWRGGDEKEFEADVKRKLVPAMQQLIQAIAGFGTNLGQATQVMDSADQQIQGLANGLGDVFNGIF